MFCPVDKVYVVVCFLLDNSPASEFYVCRRFGTLCSTFIGGYVSMNYLPTLLWIWNRVF